MYFSNYKYILFPFSRLEIPNFELKEASRTSFVLCIKAFFSQVDKTPQLSRIKGVIESKCFH